MNESSSPSIRWLHVSDLHLRDPRDPGKQGDQGEVLTAFLKFCHKPMREEYGFAPDFVFITGDLGFSGTSEDYEGGSSRTVRNFLDVLRRATRLDAEHIFAVSGNHDVDRRKIGKDTARGDLCLAGLRSEGEGVEAIRHEVAERLYPSDPLDFDDRDRVLLRHQDYVRFCRSYWPSRFSLPGAEGTALPGEQVLPVLTYSARLHVPRSGFRFGLAGLCSSWASQSAFRITGQEDEPQKQLLCIKSVEDCLDALRDETFRIALIHHSPEWLHPDEAAWARSEAGLLGQVDVLLTGHGHRAAESDGIRHSGLRAIHCSAGSIFDGMARNNAFSLVEVWPALRLGRQLVFRWHDRSGVWAPDASIARGREWIEFELRPPGATTSTETAGVVAPVPIDTRLYCVELVRAMTLDLMVDAKHRWEVDRLYVEPQAVDCLDPGLPGTGQPLPPVKPVPIGLGEALGAGSTSVVVAGPGAGKTASLVWLGFHAARQHCDRDGSALLPELAWLRNMVPFWVSAPVLAREQERALGASQRSAETSTFEPLFRCLNALASEPRVTPLAEACAREAVAQGNVLLLIDDLDQVPPAARRGIVGLAGQLESSRVVYTARPGGCERTELGPGTRMLSLLPFDQGRMEAYVDRWFACRRKWTDRHLSEPEIRERRTELLRAVRSSHSLQSLARTPWLLTTLAAVQESNGRLSDNRAELYHRSIELLLARWSAPAAKDAGIEIDPHARRLWNVTGVPDPGRLTQVLENVAYRLFIERQELNPQVDESALVTLLSAAMTSVDQAEGTAPRSTTRQAGALLELAAYRPGLLVEHSPGQFGFLHSTFQEYLTARYCCGTGPQNALAYHADNGRWREVIRLAVAELVREPNTRHLGLCSRLMDSLARRLTGPERWHPEWLEVADTAVGCLEELGSHEVSGALVIASAIIARATAKKDALRSGEPAPRELALAIRLPACLGRLGLLSSVAAADLASACFAATSCSDGSAERVWPAIRAFSEMRGAARPKSLTHVFEYFANFGSDDQRFIAKAVLGTWNPNRRAARIYGLTAALVLENSEPPNPFEVAPTEVSQWRSILHEVDDEPRLFVPVSMVANPFVIWDEVDYARAAVRAFAAESSRAAGVRVLRGLLSEAGTRPAALEALEEGLLEDDQTVSVTSASLLAEVQTLPPASGARAAVRALTVDACREAGARVMRELLAEDTTRPAALEGLREGLLGSDWNVAATGASLLAEVETLPADERAHAAVQAFSAPTCRQAGVRAMGQLLGEATTRETALSALAEGLRDSDWDIAGTSASLLAEEKALPADVGAHAMVRAFHDEVSRSAAVPVMRGLLRDDETRGAALLALGEALRDDTADVAVTSASLLFEHKALPPEPGARALVLAFHGENSRPAAAGVVRQLLGDTTVRPAALAALEEGLSSTDADVAGTSASLLAEENALPAEAGARAAVRAFSAESSRSAGAALIRGLLGDPENRGVALGALEQGLDDTDAEIAGASASLLAEESALPADFRARAAIRNFGLGGRREAAVRVMRELMAQDATRGDALAMLEQGLGDRDWAIAGTSASLLAEEKTLSADHRARAAVRAFSAESSREAGIRVIYELLGDPQARPAALGALGEGLIDGDSDTAVTSANLLADEKALEAEPGARAAVQAFYLVSSRGAGVRLMLALLGQNAARPTAIGALREGLRDRDRNTAVTCASLLAESGEPGAASGARAAVRALAADSSREVGMRVLFGLLEEDATREAALQALRDGELDIDPDIARYSAALLAQAEAGG